MKFRNKPVVIDAVQWNGENHREMFEFLEEIRGSYLNPHGKNFYIDHSRCLGGLVIKTPEGEHIASIGDWIIKDIKGEFYPINPYIFKGLYHEEPDACRCGRVGVHE